MDVIRKQSRARRGARCGILVLALASLLIAATAGLSFLEPALPKIDRSTIILDTVQRGTFVREVRGSGTLVPVDVTWVTAEVGGTVLEVLVEPGIEVTPDTELLKLRDPQLERAVREATRDVESAKASLERFKLRRQSLQLDLKVAIANARANFEEAREQAAQPMVEAHVTRASSHMKMLEPWKNDSIRNTLVSLFVRLF